ncbi:MULTISPECIES: alanine racemase [Legionella]|uniref:Alanine racemase n=1 Tax=Legionella septentrionalis TaxID=2498109 RepID=A0A3S0XGC8_9GAMM|nr:MULTISPECIES: alanine racemase [Legionella]MCP0913596.1 alanine racemase [Legionella sp. 27cVA30]RUQ88215.1 alanine racemase [Legionella septentrionalis]RUQ97457.1 alanine racemase [Legionella septentrionalis]RUR09753.1 alanine racemase [Legionella septentrionalis]RUR15955.1 alanine racemase [Legionella septentrionalis]
MTRPTRLYIDATALLHNIKRIRQCAPGKKIIAMVKANAYGCGLASVIPVLEGEVHAFGVASLEEAMTLRTLGSRSECILFQGIFSPDELSVVVEQGFQCVIHSSQQLNWILNTPLAAKIKVWVKVNTGMHRLGFPPERVGEIITALRNSAWIDEEIGVMTHLACADEPENLRNQQQLAHFQALALPPGKIVRSIANSAAILALPETHADVVRPGIMLYGVSPFLGQTGVELGLIPVMNLVSRISVIHHYPSASPIGYGGRWKSDKPSIIGIVPIGYGDGYPRHMVSAPTWVNGFIAPVVGRISMDMLTIDLTACPGVKEGDLVELWGKNIPVEAIANLAGTFAYELLCQISPRVRG